MSLPFSTLLYFLEFRPNLKFLDHLKNFLKCSQLFNLKNKSKLVLFFLGILKRFPTGSTLQIHNFVLNFMARFLVEVIQFEYFFSLHHDHISDLLIVVAIYSTIVDRQYFMNNQKSHSSTRHPSRNLRSSKVILK